MFSQPTNYEPFGILNENIYPILSALFCAVFCRHGLQQYFLDTYSPRPVPPESFETNIENNLVLL
jgi:hypothetical protein